MAEYLSPGVYIEEIEVGPKPIEGVSTSNLGMAGMSERGPEEVRLVGSWLEFRRLYGDPVAAERGRYFAHAVRGFFDNGGRRLFVARVSGTGAGRAFRVLGNSLRIRALGPGVSGNHILVKVSEASLAGDDRFKLHVIYFREGVPDPLVDPTLPGAQAQDDYVEPTQVEVYDNLSSNAVAPTEAVRTLAGSSLIEAFWEDPDAPAAPGPADFEALEDGADGVPPTLQNFQGREVTEQRGGETVTYETGLLGLEGVDEVSLLAAPDEHAVPGLRSEVIGQCQRLRDRFALLSVESGQRNVQGIVVDPPTDFAALYWPWVFVQHPSQNRRVLVPPVGHAAGIAARLDVERGVHKAPANAVVRGAVELEFPVSRTHQDILNPRGVNVIRDFRPDGRGLRLWGARTMSADPSWKYINVRRLFLFLEESIDEGTQWVVFEPNSEALWDRVRRSIEGFLTTVWRNGALMGTSPEQAFYVKCDRSTMTEDDIQNGRLVCYIGVAPVKPAEFVIFRIHQWTFGAEMAA